MVGFSKAVIHATGYSATVIEINENIDIYVGALRLAPKFMICITNQGKWYKGLIFSKTRFARLRVQLPQKTRFAILIPI